MLIYSLDLNLVYRKSTSWTDP